MRKYLAILLLLQGCCPSTPPQPPKDTSIHAPSAAQAKVESLLIHQANVENSTNNLWVLSVEEINNSIKEGHYQAIVRVSQFDKSELDFLERCDACFHLFMTMPEDQRPKLGVPFVPIYNGDR